MIVLARDNYTYNVNIYLIECCKIVVKWNMDIKMENKKRGKKKGANGLNG